MTIAEVAKKYDLSTDTLRYYERIGLVPPITRTASGIRDYKEKDLGWVEFIKCMRGAMVSIEALAEYVSLFLKGDSTHEARKAILKEEYEALLVKIETLQKGADRLKYKIENYDEIMKKPKDNQETEEAVG